MDGLHEPADVLPFERQADEPGRMFAIFVRYLETSPRSLRAACAAFWKEEAREPGARVPGAVYRASVRWRWQERAAEYDAWVAEREAALFRELRLARRKRRLQQLDRAGELIGQRLEKMRTQDIKPGRLFQEIERIHGLEREELLDTAEHRRGEDRADHGLPSIDDRIRPPDSHDETDEGGRP